MTDANDSSDAPPRETTDGGQSASTGSEERGSVYIHSINDQVASEDARKQTLEERGVRVITTSGALATLLFAIAALTHSGTSPLDLAAPDESFLVAALIFFVLAAIMGLLTNLPLGYRSLSDDELIYQASQAAWDNYDAIVDSREIANQKVDLLLYARQANDRKATFLLGGFSLEVIAVVCVAAAVAIIVEHHPAVWVIGLGVFSGIVFLFVVTRAGSSTMEFLAEERSRERVMARRKKDREVDSRPGRYFTE